MSELWAKDLDDFEREQYERSAEFVRVPQIGEGGPEDPEIRNLSLTEMRRRLVQKMNVMIAVGGKQHSTDKLIPGVAEELSLARQRGMPCFLVGGLGGMAASLARKKDDSFLALDNELPAEANQGIVDDQRHRRLCWHHLQSSSSQFRSFASRSQRPRDKIGGFRGLGDCLL